jgi:hypothetical protein
MSAPRKAWTVEEADGLIPRMEEVLAMVRDRVRRIESCHEQLQLLDVLWGDRVREDSNPDHAEFADQQDTMKRAAHEIEELVAGEIAGRGIRFPSGGLEHGLLDFPTTWQGRWIFLCWKSGEKRITAWHEVNGGFAGRQPLTADHARRMGREDDPAHVDDSMLDF